MLTVKNIKNNAICSVRDLHVCLFSFSAEVIWASFNFSTVSVHSSTNSSTNFFLYLQFSYSKYSPTSHDLSHSHSQLVGFQINLLSHTPLSINSLHSHFYLSSFQRCLLLQTLLSSLHLHLHVSCHSMCIVLLVLDIRLNTLTFKFLSTSGTHDFAYGLLILLQLPLYLLVSMLKGKKTLHY